MVPGAGVEPARSRLRGIFIPATAFAAARGITRICGLDFTFALSCTGTRGRQEPSSLYTSRDAHGFTMRAGFSSGLPPPSRAEVPPNLTPFTPAVSVSWVLNAFKSLASTNFATRAASAIVTARAPRGKTLRLKGMVRRIVSPVDVPHRYSCQHTDVAPRRRGRFSGLAKKRSPQGEMWGERE
jgi:hypothetical protein